MKPDASKSVAARLSGAWIASGFCLISLACASTSGAPNQMGPGLGGDSSGALGSAGGSTGGAPAQGVVPTSGGSNAGGNTSTLGGGTGGSSVAGVTSSGGNSSTGGDTSSAAGATGLGGAPSTPGLVAAGVRWVGRVDLTDPSLPKFAWSGTGFVATVSGTALAVQLRTEGTTEPIFFQPVIDGAPGPRFSVANGTQAVTLATGLADGAHRVEVYRETEGMFGDSVFEGFTQGTLQDPPTAPARLIELVGDSISAGFGNLGVEQHPNFGPDPTGGCAFTTETESAYMTFGAIAARALEAEASIVALSGWGIFRDNANDPTRVLPNVYDNALGILPTPAWQFLSEPQVVVINLGTNDFALGDPGQAEFTGAYTAFLTRVRSQYPDAWIFCAVGSLLFDPGLTSARAYHTAIVADANQRGDTRVVLVDFGQQNSSLGTGCSFHPNVTEQTRLAGILGTAIRANLGW